MDSEEYQQEPKAEDLWRTFLSNSKFLPTKIRKTVQVQIPDAQRTRRFLQHSQGGS